MPNRKLSSKGKTVRELLKEVGAGKDALPPELQRLVGEECDCGEACPPDPRISCQYTGQMITVTSAYIQNAQKGDLILCPGDAGGTIGGLLHALTPAQHYSHMGIFVRDQKMVRHATCIEDRSSAEEYYSDSLFGSKVPLHGLRADKLRYGWPGTVTQTVFQAFRAYRKSGINQKLQECKLPDTESATGASYNIAELSFEPVFDPSVDPVKFPGGYGFPPQTVFPLIVKPCPLLETPLVRSILREVAAKAMEVFGHYRFFSYTYTNIALDASKAWVSPAWESANPDPLLAFPESKDPFFIDPNDATHRTTRRPSTVPVVCSSFAWLATQLVDQGHAQSHSGRRIVLDASTTRQFTDPPLATVGCDSEVQPEWSGDDESKKFITDGVYHYGNDDRQRAAQKLYDNVRQTVADTMRKKIPGPILDALNLVDPAALLVALASGGGAVAILLGIDIATSAGVIRMLVTIPESIANQTCNAFASDYCEQSARSSDNWKKPGSTSSDPPFEVTPRDGYAVSPDDIAWFWDPPSVLGPNDALGLYGYNERAIFRIGKVNRPVCKWVPAGPLTTVEGVVTFKGQPVAGAIVKICCEFCASKAALRRGTPGFQLQVPAGRYFATATYTYKSPDGTYWGLDGGVDTGDLDPANPNWIEIPLQPPPAEKRMIVVIGHADLTDVQLFDDDTATKQFNCPPMFAEYDPTSGASFIPAGYTVDDQNEGDAHVRLEVWIDDVRSDRSIVGHFTVSMPDEDNLSWGNNFTINEDSQRSWKSDLDGGGVFPDRVHAEFGILNMRAP